MSRKSTFPHRLWHWTRSDENLFQAGTRQLEFFKLLTLEAFK